MRRATPSRIDRNSSLPLAIRDVSVPARNTERVRRIGIGKAFDRDEHECSAAFRADLLKRQKHVHRSELVDLRWRHRDRIDRLRHRCHRLEMALGAPRLVDEQMVHDREQPAARQIAGRPALHPRQRPLEAVLHEIVGCIAVAQQRARIAAQPWDLVDDRLPALVDAPGRLLVPLSALFSRFEMAGVLDMSRKGEVGDDFLGDGNWPSKCRTPCEVEGSC